MFNPTVWLESVFKHRFHKIF